MFSPAKWYRRTVPIDSDGATDQAATSSRSASTTFRPVSSHAAPDSPFVSLWRQFANADWVADVGVPLVAALSAIALSYLLVRRQLRQDRDLWRAERRIEAARSLGRALLEEAERPDQEDADAPFWSSEAWPDFRRILKVSREAEITLGSDAAIEDAISVSRSALWVWRSCQHSRPGLVAEKLDVVAINDGLQSTINQWQIFMRNFGRSLIGWDGLDAVPRLDMGRKTHVPLPAKTRPHHAAWIKHYQQEFIDTARRIDKRYKQHD